MACSSAQSDIRVFIARAIQERLEDEDLVIEDPSLANEISDALVKGAEGM